MTPKPGVDELRAARRASRPLYWFVGLFSAFVNLLMLTGPLYMLQVYDRVLGSRSVETLVALTGLVAFLYLMMGILDYARGRVMARAGARFQAELDGRVFDASVRKSAWQPDANSITALSDLAAIRGLMTSPALTAVFDTPWTPLFLAGIWIFHPWLGMLAMAGGVILIVITTLNQWLSRGPTRQSARATQTADTMAIQIRAEAESVEAMGMRANASTRWKGARNSALGAHVGAADVGGTFSVITKTLRLFLQSAMLGLGAFLVLRGELTAGAMIAASILLGRALAPIELLIGQWPMVLRARQGWSNLSKLLADVPPEPQRTALPRPAPILDVQGVAVVPPGKQHPSLRGVTFNIQPGQVVGVIGITGSGKSTLARALTGVWPLRTGTIRLGGAALDQYGSSVLGQHIGYLPQRVQLFDGTVSENIARLTPNADDAAVVAAAQKADAHEMILALPQGYDTPVTANGGGLSGGQLQRIGLARAMFGDPVLLVLDEPNSNLDAPGSAAFNRAVHDFRSAGGAILIIAHRPAAIRECDMIVLLEDGVMRAFGPKDEVLKSNVRNSEQLATPKGPPPGNGTAKALAGPTPHGAGAARPSTPPPPTQSPDGTPPRPKSPKPTAPQNKGPKS
ncbi:type I secretion system permease/ATPase [Rhodobacteraceae bacterium KMM 6894]|nr:type I secretion system permease/ATPase [Rhodobacteraceae bacterium KMM 6894]